MKLRCVTNRASDLAGNQRGRGTQHTHVYDLTIGSAYRVAGMVLWETMLWFLIRGDDGAPLNAPAGLFERLSSTVPADWLFAVGPGASLEPPALWEQPVVAIWGYPALVNDPTHLPRLFDGGFEELESFSRYLDWSGVA
jgi:hypothetical protein